MLWAVCLPGVEVWHLAQRRDAKEGLCGASLVVPEAKTVAERRRQRRRPSSPQVEPIVEVNIHEVGCKRCRAKAEKVCAAQTAVEWKRVQDSSGTHYVGAFRGQEALEMTCFGTGEWYVGRRWSDDGYSAETKDEAKLAAEVMVRGGNPSEHRTSVSHRRVGKPPRGSWTTIWSWRCRKADCPHRSQMGLDQKTALRQAREHRMASMSEFVYGGEDNHGRGS